MGLAKPFDTMVLHLLLLGLTVLGDTVHHGGEKTMAVAAVAVAGGGGGGGSHHIHNQEAESDECLCPADFLLLVQSGTSLCVERVPQPCLLVMTLRGQWPETCLHSDSKPSKLALKINQVGLLWQWSTVDPPHTER